MAYNSTIISKKRKLACGCFDFAFSKNKCRHHAIIDSTNKRIAEYEESEDAESWQSLRDDLDYVYSQWVRISASGSDGMCECYTCGKIYRYQNMDCGHFIPRDNNGTRFLPENTKPQCKTCNQYKDGNEEAFAIHLELDGISVAWLRQVGREVSRPTISELKELLILYRNKLRIAQLKLKK